ncbi:MAG: L-threonylcarbamoyladenylate synthase [Egibacteraceae bacterium]
MTIPWSDLIAELPMDADELREAAEMLRAGGLVAFPTETVYGLGANAFDERAVARIFEVKGRPADNPLIVHLAGESGLAAVAADIPPLAQRLAARFWPGPLTLVVPAAPALPAVVTGGLGTVAVRVPDHPVALALLDAAGVPVAAPSANRSGRPSPTTAAHVTDDFGGQIDLVLDAGPCELGLESTVVDARGDHPVVLREGAVTREQLGLRPESDGTAADLATSPGTRHRHYTPRCDVEIAAIGEGPARARALAATGSRVGLVAPRDASGPAIRQLGRYADAAELGRMLYRTLRAAEKAGVDIVVVEAVEPIGIGRAVMDRLERAAAR